MKKIVSLALALLLSLSLVACGGTNNGAADNANTAGNSGNTTNNSENTDAADGEQAGESDLQYIKDKGTRVVGMTNFAPMDCKDENGEWIGFDADMAKAFAEYLGVEVEFLEINWSNKLMELDAKGIDVIWNGMTINDEVKNGASVSEPYCLNGQV